MCLWVSYFYALSFTIQSLAQSKQRQRSYLDGHLSTLSIVWEHFWGEICKAWQITTWNCMHSLLCHSSLVLDIVELICRRATGCFNPLIFSWNLQCHETISWCHELRRALPVRLRFFTKEVWTLLLILILSSNATN